MKRSFLEELGIEKEVIDKIMTENGNDIEKAKGSLTDIQKERDDLKKAVDERDKQIEDIKKSTGDNEALKKQIEELQNDNKSIKLNSAIERALLNSKAKNVVAVKALLKLDNAELSEDGTIKGLDEQIKAIQKDNDYLFNSETQKKPVIKGANINEPNDDKPKGITKDDFRKMTYKERVELFNTDKETYDEVSKN